MERIEIRDLLRAVSTELAQMSELAADLDALIAEAGPMSPRRAQEADRLRQTLADLSRLAEELAERSPSDAIAGAGTLSVLRLQSLADRLAGRIKGNPMPLHGGEAEFF